MGRALGEELAQLKARARAPELRDLVLGLSAARKMGPIRPVPDKFERLLIFPGKGPRLGGSDGGRAERATSQNGLLCMKLPKSCCLLTSEHWQDVSLSTLAPNT